MTIIDDIYAATKQPKKLFSWGADKKNQKNFTFWMENAIRQSRHYIVDADVSRAAARFGVEHPEILKTIMLRARLPFDRVWVEWDNHAAIEEVGHMKAAPDSPRYVGAFVQQHTSSQFMITMAGNQNDTVVLSPISILYDIEKPIHRNVDLDTICKLSGVPKQVAELTFVGTALVPLPSENQAQKAIRKETCIELSQHATLIFTPIIKDVSKTNGLLLSNMIGKHLQNYIYEDAGTWRFIISLFSLINSRDFVSDNTVKVAGSYIRHGKVVPYLEHRNVSLKLPRHIVEKRLFRILKNETLRRRRSEVEGHYKHDRSSGSMTCEHIQYVKVTDNLEECTECKRRRWWVKSHMRGDATLGFIVKTRKVMKKS